MRFIPRWQHQLFTQCIHRFITSKARRVRSNLEEDSTSFTEINRIKVLAVLNRCRMMSMTLHMKPPFLLLSVILCTPSDMVNGACTSCSLRNRCCLQINNITQITSSSITAIPVSISDMLHSHCMDKRFCSLQRIVAVEHSTTEPFDSMLGWNPSERPFTKRSFLTFHQFNAQSVIISKG
ncbi:hypothetical protein D3C71_1649500 [compost metagenome]